MSGKVVVIGSLNMDIVVSAERVPVKGETIHGKAVHYLPGGKGANQAVGLKRLGNDAAFIGAVGDDLFGERLVNQLKDFQLNTSYISKTSKQATGIANILRVQADNSIIVIPGANEFCTPELVEYHQSLIAEADILLMQLEIPLPTVEAALSFAEQHGTTVILNPAPARKLTADTINKLNFITPNQTELESLLDWKIKDKQDLKKAFEKWQSCYRCCLVVTLGEEGCAYMENGQLHLIPALNVKEVVDTTGAGDAFNAAFAYGLAKSWALSKVLAFSVSAASLSVEKMGAQSGMPTYEEVVSCLEG